MKITDLKEGMIVNSTTKGEGMILKVTKRTVTTKFRYSTSKITLRSIDENISFSDL
jgi:hypothetical protein